MAEVQRSALIGRGTEHRELEQRVALTVDGLGGLVLLSGDAGIGKTALAQQTMLHARQRGVETAWAGCWQVAAAPPLLPWTHLISQLGAEGGAPPDLNVDLADPELARVEQARRVEHWLRSRAHRPLLIVLEDIHWADAGTLSVLLQLATIAPGLPILILATHRPVSVAGAAFRAAASDLLHLATRVELTGLDLASTGDLVSSLTGYRVDQAAVETIARLTGGNPLFTRELIRTLPEQALAHGPIDLAEIDLPTSLQVVITERVASTSAACRTMLQILSVAGDEVPIDVLTAATDRDRDALLALVDEGTASRLVTRSNDNVSFRHALFRAAVYESLPSADRVRLHDRIGRALLERRAAGADVEAAALAHHFGAAAALGNAERAFTYANLAAEEAIGVLAYDVAVRRYQDAMAMLALDPTLGDRSQLMLALADAQVASGDPEAARKTFWRVAQETTDPETLGRAALGFSGGMGGFEVVVGDADVCALLERAASGLEGDDDLGSRVLARLSVALTFRSPIATRAEMVSTARRRAAASENPATVAEVLAAWCDVMAGPAHVAEREVAAREIVDRARHVGDLGTVALGRRLLVVALAESGDLDELAREIDRFAAATSRLGRSEYRWYAPLWRAALATARGQPAAWMRAREELDPLVESGGANAVLLSKVQLCSMAFDLADASLGQHFFDEIMDPQLVMDDTQTLITTVLLRGLAGDLDDVDSMLDRCVDEALTTEPDSEWPAMMLQLAELVALTGGHRRAADLLAVIEPHASVWAIEGITAGIRGPLSRAMGLLSASDGNAEAAREYFDHARTEVARVGADLLGAVVDDDVGTMLGDADALRRAEATWQRLGAESRLERLDRHRRSPTARSSPTPAASSARNPPPDRFVSNGEVWTITFEGEVCTLPDRKGLQDLARLLAEPGVEISSLDLMSPGGSVVEPAAGEVIDAKARDAYRARLDEIESELDDADRTGDVAKSERLVAEREALVQQLSEAFGLGGRPRPAGASAERARTAVRNRVRDALRRIEEVHPDLGRHLTRSVRTGTYCVYDPDPVRSWEVVAPSHTV